MIYYPGNISFFVILLPHAVRAFLINRVIKEQTAFVERTVGFNTFLIHGIYCTFRLFIFQVVQKICVTIINVPLVEKRIVASKHLFTSLVNMLYIYSTI